MPDATWKAVNRAICKLLGGRRAGYDGKGGADCSGTAPYCVEVKHRRELPDWIRGALLQAQVSAKRTELAIAVLHQERALIKDSFVVIRLGDFIDWFVGATHEE